MTRFHRAAEIAGSALRHFREDHAFNHAAAVAYYALLALGPFIYLSGLLLGWLVPDLRTGEAALTAFGGFVPPEIVSPLADAIDSWGHGKGLVAVAIPGLVWVASTTFSALEVSLSVAFATSRNRRFLLSRVKSFLGFLALGLLLVTGLVVDRVTAGIEFYRERMGLPPILGPRAAWLSTMLILAVTYVALTLLFKGLPRGRVAWSAAAIAAVPTLILWEITRHVFGGFLLHSPGMDLMAGVFAAIMGLLLWVYVAVLIVLFGAELAAVLNGSRPIVPSPAGETPSVP